MSTPLEKPNENQWVRASGILDPVQIGADRRILRVLRVDRQQNDNTTTLCFIATFFIIFEFVLIVLYLCVYM